MSVTGATTRNDYVASAGQNVFNYTFQILISSDLKVLKNGTALTLNNDYTVAITDQSGGVVTLNSAASVGDTVSIFLAMPIDRTTQYQNAGDFLASDVNGDFDKGYIAMNQLQTDIARSIKLADQDQTVDLELPLSAARANKFLSFDANGNLNVTTGTPIAATTTNEISYTLAQTEAVQRNLTDRLGDYISVKDFGAICNGSNDDTSAVRKCVANAPEGSVIVFPNTCAISDEIQITRKLVIKGAGNTTPTLIKLPGFPNKPALTVGDGSSGLSGVAIYDFAIDGNNQSGDGAKFQKLGSLNLTNFRSENNKGWGMVRNGLWLSSMTNIVIIKNGTAASGGSPATGGGVVDSFSIRETSDLTCINFNSNFNHNRQMLWDDAVANDDGGTPYRMVGFYQLGGEYGTNSQVNLTEPVTEIRSADRCGFYGVKFNSAENTNVHCLQVGSPSDAIAQPLSDIVNLNFDSCHTQKNHDSSNDFYGVNVTNRVTSIFFNRQSHNGSEKFINLASVTSGSVYLVNSESILWQKIDDPNKIIEKDVLSVEDFGVKPDGTTENQVDLQEAIDYAASTKRQLYFPRGTGYIRVTRPIYVRTNSNWIGPGEIHNDNPQGNINSTCLLPGAFAPVYFKPHNSNITGYTHYPINAVNSGRTITTTTASHAGNFSAGDLVWVSTVTTWVGNAGDYPITAHLAEVVSANNSTGVIVMDNPISERMAALYGSLQVCKAEDSSINDVKQNPLKLCKNATIDGLSISAPYAGAIQRGGMYKCSFNFNKIVAKNSIFANGIINSTITVKTAITTRKVCDIAGFSSDFYIRIDSAIYDGSIATSNLPSYCRVGECGRNGIIEVVSNNCGGYIDPDPLVIIGGGSKNVGQIHRSVNAPDHGEETGTGAPFRIQQAVSSNRQIYHTGTVWAGSTAYPLNARVLNGGNGYQCTQSGTSASSGGPSGTGSEISDGTAKWKYVTNVSAVGETVLNYATEFAAQQAPTDQPLKVYRNNIQIPLGAGAGKFTVTDSNTTITLGTPLITDDKIKIGLDSDYQLSNTDCWIDVNARLGANVNRAGHIADTTWNADPPTVSYLQRNGFRNFKITSDADYDQEAVKVEGWNSYVHGALCNHGNAVISTYAKEASIEGFFDAGVQNLSTTAVIDDLVKQYVDTKTDQLRVDNSAAATTLGTVVKKIEVFDESGVSLGFIPVYNAIT